MVALNFDKESNKIAVEDLVHFWMMSWPADFSDNPKSGNTYLKYGYDH
jgi:hypothetical protein